MSTLNTVGDMVKYIDSISNLGGIICLWRDDNSSPNWQAKVNESFESLSNKMKFGFFHLPYPLAWRDNSGNGTFWINRAWRGVWRKQAFHGGDVSKIWVEHKGKHYLSDGGKGNTTEFWHLDEISPVYTPLQTDKNIWLPYCDIPPDGLPGNGLRRIYLTPFNDGETL